MPSATTVPKPDPAQAPSAADLLVGTAPPSLAGTVIVPARHD